MTKFTVDHAVEFLTKHRLLTGLDDRARQDLRQIVEVIEFPKNAMIFSKGDPGDGLYGVMAGRVEITAIAAEGKEIILNIIDSGKFFGEIALLDGGPRTANAVAMEASHLLRLPHLPFLSFLQRHPILCCDLIRFLCGRLRDVNETVENMVFLDCPGRLAKELLAMAGGGETTPPITQEKLSRKIGCSREMVSTRLNIWQSGGLIERRGSRYRLCDKSALEALVGEPGEA